MRLKYKIKEDINAVSKWMIGIKLSLNTSKSNVVIINSNEIKNDKSSKHSYDNVLPEILIVKNAKHLGVTFDKSLFFFWLSYWKLDEKIIAISWNSSKGKAFFKQKGFI